jgi:hypothetical protein
MLNGRAAPGYIAPPSNFAVPTRGFTSLVVLAHDGIPTVAKANTKNRKWAKTTVRAENI